jgi:Uma2 family endonuclease
MAAIPKLMTVAQMLALPENGMDRELIRGELREWPMTMRNRRHNRAQVRVARVLDEWLDSQPLQRGEVICGEAGFRLARDPDTGVGIDVAYVSADVSAREPEAAYFDGSPVVTVEILSPSDQQDEVDEKIEPYLESGAAAVWMVNARFRTVAICRPGERPTMVNVDQLLCADPYRPGSQVPVAALFGQ